MQAIREAILATDPADLGPASIVEPLRGGRT